MIDQYKSTYNIGDAEAISKVDKQLSFKLSADGGMVAIMDKNGQAPVVPPRCSGRGHLPDELTKEVVE